MFKLKTFEKVYSDESNFEPIVNGLKIRVIHESYGICIGELLENIEGVKNEVIACSCNDGNSDFIINLRYFDIETDIDEEGRIIAKYHYLWNKV